MCKPNNHSNDSQEFVYALSLWQPWASLLTLGEKQFETRHWPIQQKSLPRTTVIHAAGRWSRAQRELCEQDPFIRASLVKQAVTLAENVNSGKHYLPHINFMLDDVAISLPLGCLIGLGDFVNCWPTDGAKVSRKEAAMGNYATGRFAWCFKNPQLITPVPQHGRQRWWRVPNPLTTQESNGNRDSIQ